MWSASGPPRGASRRSTGTPTCAAERRARRRTGGSSPRRTVAWAPFRPLPTTRGPSGLQGLAEHPFRDGAGVRVHLDQRVDHGAVDESDEVLDAALVDRDAGAG